MNGSDTLIIAFMKSYETIQVHTQNYNENDEGQYFQITKQSTDCYKLKVLHGNGILHVIRSAIDDISNCPYLQTSYGVGFRFH